jgi:hypothetical protein
MTAFVNGWKGRRVRVLATVTGISLGMAGVLLFVRFGPPPTPDSAAPNPAAAAHARSAAANSGSAASTARGPGLPPPPGASQNAPPNPYGDAPTANLKRVANALRWNNKSITAVVTLPAGLNLTAPVDVSILFGAYGPRATQTYNNATGNRYVHNFPDRDGLKRPEELIISLMERGANGDNSAYAVRPTVQIEPLYDLSTSPLRFLLVNDCDDVGASEVLLQWLYPDYQPGKFTRGMRGGQSIDIAAFARTYLEVGQSANLKEPKFTFNEEDPGGFYSAPDPSVASPPLLPGTTRTINLTEYGPRFCSAQLRYTVTYRLRQYLFLDT